MEDIVELYFAYGARSVDMLNFLFSFYLWKCVWIFKLVHFLGDPTIKDEIIYQTTVLKARKDLWC